MKRKILVALIVTTISAFRGFDLVFVMTKGGPGDTTALPAWQIYRRAFFYGEVGSAAALGVVLAVVILVFVLAIGRSRRLAQ